MRIQNKYLRNRHFRIKNWKRIRNTEHPFETFNIYWFHGRIYDTTEDQVKRHFEWINEQARRLEKGSRRIPFDSASSGYRRQLNKERKAQVRRAMVRINGGDYEYEVPVFKRDAAWLYW